MRACDIGPEQPGWRVLLLVTCLGSLSTFTCAAFAQGSLVNLGGLNGGSLSSATGVSSDGRLVVGTAADASLANVDRAFRWAESSGLISLSVTPLFNKYVGLSPQQFYSRATAVSGDGRVIVGYAGTTLVTGDERAFRWTQSEGMVDIGDSAAALAVNQDGTVIVGEWQRSAFRWTQAGGMISLGTLNGGRNAKAFGVSADGGVIVGVATDGAAGNAGRAFRWTQTTGIVSLGVLNGGDYSFANAISSNGSTVVGIASDGAPASNFRAFRWTQSDGIRSLGVLAR